MQRQYLNSLQPSAMRSAAVMMYLSAALGVLSVLLGGVVSLAGGGLLVLALQPLLGIGQGVCAFFMSNDSKWGYWIGIVLTALLFLNSFAPLILSGLSGPGLFNVILYVLFQGAILALLVHPSSREYGKVWLR